MSEIKMTDEEFMAFINANKERMNALMGNDKDVKAFLKENAKKAKAKVEKVTDATEDTVKKVFSASQKSLRNPEGFRGSSTTFGNATVCHSASARNNPARTRKAMLHAIGMLFERSSQPANITSKP